MVFLTKGATTNTIGNATNQEESHVSNQVISNSGTKPIVCMIAIKVTMHDIMPDKRKPKSMNSNFGGMKGFMSRSFVGYFIENTSISDIKPSVKNDECKF